MRGARLRHVGAFLLLLLLPLPLLLLLLLDQGFGSCSPAHCARLRLPLSNFTWLSLLSRKLFCKLETVGYSGAALRLHTVRIGQADLASANQGMWMPVEKSCSKLCCCFVSPYPQICRKHPSAGSLHTAGRVWGDMQAWDPSGQHAPCFRADDSGAMR